VRGLPSGERSGAPRSRCPADADSPVRGIRYHDSGVLKTKTRRTLLDHLAKRGTLLSSNAQPAAGSPVSRRHVPLPLLGAGVCAPGRQGLGQDPSVTSGPRDGDRAPPRGVDVKPTPAGRRGGLLRPLEGPGRGSGGSRTPVWGLPARPGLPGPWCSVPDPSARGGFTSTPRAGALSPVSGLPEREGSPGPSGAQNPQIPRNWGKSPKSRFLGLPRGTPENRQKWGYRAPPRGVDVKPPRTAGLGNGKIPQNGVF